MKKRPSCMIPAARSPSSSIPLPIGRAICQPPGAPHPPPIWKHSASSAPSTAVVHCVHITPDDAHILKKRGVTAILCPRSNERLAVGRAPAPLLKKCGIPLALGTDSLASNDSLSLWDEMRFFRREFPGEFTPEEILEYGHARRRKGPADRRARPVPWKRGNEGISW